jgi:hypothetical protein
VTLTGTLQCCFCDPKTGGRYFDSWQSLANHVNKEHRGEVTEPQTKHVQFRAPLELDGWMEVTAREMGMVKSEFIRFCLNLVKLKLVEMT